MVSALAERLAWIAKSLSAAPQRATDAAAEFGPEHEARELRAWVAYAVSDIERVINDINNDSNKENL